MTDPAPEEVDANPFLSAEMSGDFRGWRNSMAKVRAEIESVHLQILVWGPGSRSPDLPKRTTVMEHLAATPNNEVTTSEQLIKSGVDDFSGMTLRDREWIHWRNADLVIAIVPTEPRVTGVRTEIAIFGNDKEFLDKLVLIRPKLNQRQERELSFLERSWRELTVSRRFDFTDKQYHDCHLIRQFCADQVLSVRNERALSQMKLRGKTT